MYGGSFLVRVLDADAQISRRDVYVWRVGDRLRNFKGSRSVEALLLHRTLVHE